MYLKQNNKGKAECQNEPKLRGETLVFITAVVFVTVRHINTHSMQWQWYHMKHFLISPYSMKQPVKFIRFIFRCSSKKLSHLHWVTLYPLSVINSLKSRLTASLDMNAVASVLLIYPVIQLSDKINVHHVCLKKIQFLYMTLFTNRENGGQKQLIWSDGLWLRYSLQVCTIADSTRSIMVSIHQTGYEVRGNPNH